MPHEESQEMIMHSREAGIGLALLAGARSLHHWRRRIRGNFRSAGWTSAHCTLLLAGSLGLFALAIATAVLRGESGGVDTVILMRLHERIPTWSLFWFRGITRTGSSMVLAPLGTLATLALLWFRRRQEGILLAGALIISAATVFIMKTAVGRARPQLWQTPSSWGSSFPSGHTLVVSAVATGVALILGRYRPPWRNWAALAAVIWIALVGLSRLALGVHWPTDVLFAACSGSALVLVLDAAMTLPSRRQGQANQIPGLPPILRN